MFTGFHLVILGFNQFYWVLPSFTGFLPCFTGFCLCFFLRLALFHWVQPSFHGLYLILPGLTHFHLIVP